MHVLNVRLDWANYNLLYSFNFFFNIFCMVIFFENAVFSVKAWCTLWLENEKEICSSHCKLWAFSDKFKNIYLSICGES